MRNVLAPAFLAFALTQVPAGNAALAEDETTATGQFENAGGHETSGMVSVVDTGSGYTVVLGEDFSHDGAPDPWVGLGADGIDKDAFLAPLAELTGEQTYEVPAEIEVSGYNEVYIWCREFDTALGVAALSAP